MSKVLYYRNQPLPTKRGECECEAFQTVHLDYWAIVQMYAEARRVAEGGKDPEKYLDYDYEGDFLNDLWEGKIPFIQVFEEV